jgi:hypothetical protein
LLLRWSQDFWFLFFMDKLRHGSLMIKSQKLSLEQ